MKLAIVRQKYTPFGGAERFVARALDALRAQGVVVEVIARHWDNSAGTAMAGVRCDPFYLGRTWRDAGFARCVQNVIASGRYDLVQSHERVPGCHIFRAGDGVHATWLDLSRKPLTFLSPWHQYTLAAERAMFNHSALRAVICNSRMIRDDIARRFPAASDKLHVIYNGIDAELFHPGLRDLHRKALRQKVGAGDTAPVVLFVGSGYERKGVATLLTALAHMHTHTAEAWIVGRDKHQARYESQARQLGIADRVRFFGAQSDVRPFYGAADIFCLPTLYDPLPNAALEALACGLPVATTTSCGAAELIQSGVNGYACPPLDPTALASALDAFCNLSSSLAMGQAARNVVSNLNLEHMAARMNGLYSSLIGDR